MDPGVGQAISEAFENHSTDTFDIKPHVTFLKLFYICSILYFFLVMAIKISILLMYHRIFSIDSRFQLQSRLLGVVVLAFWLAASTTTICFCRPVGYIWMGLDLEKHCLPYTTFWTTIGVIDIIVDILILALPVRMVLRIRLSPKQKASVIFVFLLGGLQVLPFSVYELLLLDPVFSDFPSVIITGLLRVIYIYHLSRLSPSYSQGEFWSTVHITTGIICACLPTLRPLFTLTPLCTSDSAPASTSASTSPFPVRWRYYHMRGWHSRRRNSPNYDRATESKLVNTIEMLSFRSARFSRHTRVTKPQVEKVWFRDNRLV